MQGTDAVSERRNEKAQEWWQQPLNGLGDALKQSFKLKRNPFANPNCLRPDDF